MNSPEVLVPVPWDSAALGCEVWEIRPAEPAALDQALGLARKPGLYSVRVDPRADKAPLHRHGFYYCDTQIETSCAAERFRHAAHASVGIGVAEDIEALVDIGRDAFTHSHFHRDFNVDKAGADRRFENWLRQLHADGKVYRMTWDESLAGFLAHAGGGKLALYATAKPHRGRSRSQFLFGAGCAEILRQGAKELVSPFSACNLPIANIHATLGFTALKAVDIYHRVIA